MAIIKLKYKTIITIYSLFSALKNIAEKDNKR